MDRTRSTGYYFERAYPRAQDRRAFIEDAIVKGRPSFGHLALAALMSLDKVGVVWTTNFDRVVEDAAAKVLGTTTKLTIAALSSAEIAGDALREDRFPLYGKLHGDFQSDRLKNTGTELQAQDAAMRAALRTAAGRFGLAVVGYSGRDESVMEALRAGLSEVTPFPAGLYWFARGADPPLPAVTDLIAQAREAGVDAHMIKFDTFDELMGLLLVPLTIPADLEQRLEAARPASIKQAFKLPPAGKSFPVLRLNALPVSDYPRSARLVDCDIGGTRDVRNAVEAAAVSVVAHRRADGVIAFGSDADLERAFAAHSLRSLGLAPLDPINGPTSDLALTYEALLAALARDRPFKVIRRRLVVDHTKLRPDDLKDLRAVVGQLNGMIPGTSLEWAEGVELALESRLGRLWLIFTPLTWAAFDGALMAPRAEFLTRRVANRFNSKADSLFSIWSELLGHHTARSSFGLQTSRGADASFTIGYRSAFSRPGRGG